MSLQLDTINEPCAVCGTFYTTESGQSHCAICLTELISDLYIAPTNRLQKIEDSLKNDKEQLQESVFYSILASVQGDISKSKKSNLYKNIQKVADQATLDNWEAKFLSEESKFYNQDTFSDFLPKEGKFVFVDGTTEYLLIGVATITYGWLDIEVLATIDWVTVFPSLKNIDNDLFRFRLAGCFTKEFHQFEENSIKQLNEFILGQVDKWNLNIKTTRFFSFRGLFGWKHLDLIYNALKQSKISFTEHVYDAQRYLSAVEFIKDTSRSHLKSQYPLSIVGVQVDQSGFVKPTFLDIVSQGKIWNQMAARKNIAIQSKNISANSLLVPFVWRTSAKFNDCVPFCCYEVPLPPMSEDTILIDVCNEALIKLSTSSSQKLEAVNINYSQIIEEIPEKLNTLNAIVDLVIIVDTLANEKDMRERVNYIVDFIGSFMKSLGTLPLAARGDDLRISVIAYGDRDGALSAFEAVNKDAVWPNPIRKLEWRTPENVIDFVKTLTPFPVQYCHYEASMEDALKTANKLNWKKTARKILLTFGTRPPHDLRRNPNIYYSANSPSGVDWKTELAQLKALGAQSYVIVCKDNYWLDKESFKKDFWEELGYDLLMRKDELSSTAELSDFILESSKSSEVLSDLVLPIINVHRRGETDV